MEKRQYVCIGVAVISAVALAVFAAKKCGCCSENAVECGRRARRGKCCSKTEVNAGCQKENQAKPEVNEMGEEQVPPYYSENYYAKDQEMEE